MNRGWQLSIWNNVLGLRWWFFAAGCFATTMLEVFEHGSNPGDRFEFFSEVLLFTGLLLAIALLMEIIQKYYSTRARSAEILQSRYDFGQQLKLMLDEQHLYQEVVEAMVSLLDPAGVALLLPTGEPGALKEVASWKPDTPAGADAWLSNTAARQVWSPGQNPRLQVVEIETGQPQPDFRLYCLPLVYEDALVASLRFVLPAGRRLDARQSEYLVNISSEMAHAMRIAQQHKALAEILATESAVSERRSISRDLHDTLGQNLAYLRLKLDELNHGYAPLAAEDRQADLGTMLSVAEDSLTIVRDMIVTLRSDADTNLENQMREYGNSISGRNNLNINLHSRGQPCDLTPKMQRQIMYIYREALSNIEKHAGACNVNVSLQWDQNELVLEIEDDGLGFDPGRVDIANHFGLSIMRERVSALEGEIRVNTCPDHGTAIHIWLPI